MLLTTTIGVNGLNCNCARSYTNKHQALLPRQLKQCDSRGAVGAAGAATSCHRCVKNCTRHSVRFKAKK